MYIYIYAYIHICIYIYVCMCIYVYTYVYPVLTRVHGGVEDLEYRCHCLLTAEAARREPFNYHIAQYYPPVSVASMRAGHGVSCYAVGVSWSVVPGAKQPTPSQNKAPISSG